MSDEHNAFRFIVTCSLGFLLALAVAAAFGEQRVRDELALVKSGLTICIEQTRQPAGRAR